MNKVERAVILAAGKGERLRPITAEIPKQLIRVNGVRMIETILQALIHNGITEIYVVIGYQKEQFLELSEAYPQIVLIENPWFDICNNISSLYVARNHLENAFILDGDQIICCDQVMNQMFERSGYNAVWTDLPTDEWLMSVHNGIVTGCSREGGAHGWQLYSISRWSAADGQKLKDHLEFEFEQRENRNIYWDDIPMFFHAAAYELGITEMQPHDVIEIDHLSELIAVDNSYESFMEDK